MVLFIILNDLTFWNLKIRNDKKWDISLAGIWTNLLRSKLFGLHRIWPNKFVSYDFIHCLALSDPTFNVFLVILIYIIDTHVALLRHVLFWYLSSPHRYSTSVLVSIKKRILGNYFHNFVFKANIHSIMGSEDQVLNLMRLLDDGIRSAETIEDKLEFYDSILQVCQMLTLHLFFRFYLCWQVLPVLSNLRIFWIFFWIFDTNSLISYRDLILLICENLLWYVVFF